jgi:hypothetical protein
MTKLKQIAVIHEYAGQASLLGSPALTSREDKAAYHELFAKVWAAVKPRDFLEEILVPDFADLSWEVLRMRRLQAPFTPEISPSKLGYLETHLDAVERIDRMIMNAEARRNAALREIERRRASVAEALRRATDGIVDAEFKEVAQSLARKEVA